MEERGRETKNRDRREKKEEEERGKERAGTLLSRLTRRCGGQIRLFGADSAASGKVSALGTLIAMQRWSVAFDEGTAHSHDEGSPTFSPRVHLKTYARAT